MLFWSTIYKIQKPRNWFLMRRLAANWSSRRYLISKTSEVIPYLEFLKVPNFLLSTNILLIISQILVRTASENALEFKKINKIESRVILKEFQTDINQLHSLRKISQNSLAVTKFTLRTAQFLKFRRSNRTFRNRLHWNHWNFWSFELDRRQNRQRLQKLNRQLTKFVRNWRILENNFALKIDGLVKSLRGKASLEIMRKTGY